MNVESEAKVDKSWMDWGFRIVWATGVYCVDGFWVVVVLCSFTYTLRTKSSFGVCCRLADVPLYVFGFSCQCRVCDRPPLWRRCLYCDRSLFWRRCWSSVIVRVFSFGIWRSLWKQNTTFTKTDFIVYGWSESPRDRSFSYESWLRVRWRGLQESIITIRYSAAVPFMCCDDWDGFDER